MPLDLIKFAFVAGELSPSLYGRSDLEKFDLGMAIARNWIVDFRGGLRTRPGSRFADLVMEDDLPTKYFRFAYAPNVANTFVLLFGHFYIRFLQDGAYVLETDKVITAITQADPGVVTSTAHGFANGDWVKIASVVGMTEVNERLFEVANVAANTFELVDPLTGDNFDTSSLTAYISGGTASRVYTLVSPYDSAHLETLRAHQSRDLIYLTHTGYKPRKLLRVDNTNWTLSEESFVNASTPPGTLTLTPSAAGTAGVAFAVTAINADGIESLPTRHTFNELSINYTTTAGSMKVTWAPVVGAQHYNVYRSIVTPVGADVNQGMLLGYVGTVFAPQFIDNNIIPDFTVTPPQAYNPFADGAVLYVDVTAGGTGYTKIATVSFTGGGGSGAAAWPVVNAGGNVIGIIMTNRGSGYTSNPTVSVTVGSGATFSVTRGATSGNNPAVNSVFQQRKVYAATLNNPLTINASRPRRFNDFNSSAIVLANDGYEFELDSNDAAPIRHMLPTRAGLLLMSQTQFQQLTAGPNAAVTAINALSDPQNYSGTSLVPPIQVDVNILYIEGKGSTVRMLSYTDFSKLYAGEDVSILSAHLFKQYKLTAWDYAAEPFKIVWGRREDGALMAFTIVPEQRVFAWCPSWTKGLVEDVITVQEDEVDTVYLMVKRLVNGRWTKMIEVLAPRDFTHVEDAFCVDSGLSLTPTYPTASLTPAAAEGTGIIFTASAAVFSAGDIDSVIRVGGGKAVITGFTSSTVVVCDIRREITTVLQENEETVVPLTALEGEWTMDAPVSQVGGLWHLEGELVRILADGNVLPEANVSGGIVQFPEGITATRVTVGLGFDAIAKTLPPNSDGVVIEGKMKSVKGMAVRLDETRGLKLGPTLDRLYEMKERTDEPPGEPTLLQQGSRYQTFPGKFNPEGQIYMVQDQPLPATILGFVQEVEVGDEQDNRE